MEFFSQAKKLHSEQSFFVLPYDRWQKLPPYFMVIKLPVVSLPEGRGNAAENAISECLCEHRAAAASRLSLRRSRRIRLRLEAAAALRAAAASRLSLRRLIYVSAGARAVARGCWHLSLRACFFGALVGKSTG